MALFGGLAPQSNGLSRVGGYTSPAGKEIPKCALGDGKSVVGGAAIPKGRFRGIFSNRTRATVIKAANLVLGRGIALLCEPVPDLVGSIQITHKLGVLAFLILK